MARFPPFGPVYAVNPDAFHVSIVVAHVEGVSVDYLYNSGVERFTMPIIAADFPRECKTEQEKYQKRGGYNFSI